MTRVLSRRSRLRDVDWSDLRLIHQPRVRTRMTLLIALLLVPSAPGWAQPLDSFERLALLVNLDDHVGVQEQSGAAYTGRLARLTRHDMAIETAEGEKHFTSDVIRAVAVREHPLRIGALIGATGLAVLGSVAICSRKGGSNCAIVGAVGAAPIGAGVGLVMGSFIPQMKRVYRAPETGPLVPASPIVPDAPTSLLEDLALYVNLKDQLRVEDQSGSWTTGRLTDLTRDELTLQTAAGEQHFTRTGLRQVAVRRHHLRTGTLIGAGTGAIYGAFSECGQGARADCPDGVIIGGALGAGTGTLVATLLNRTTIVYPARNTRTVVSPQLSRAAVGVTMTRFW